MTKPRAKKRMSFWACMEGMLNTEASSLKKLDIFQLYNCVLSENKLGVSYRTAFTFASRLFQSLLSWNQFPTRVQTVYD